MNYEEHKKELEEKSKEELVKDALNETYNSFASNYADYSKGDPDPHGHGKRIAYVGWFYRSMDFAGKNFTIADCGDFIGFCESNKWDYSERNLTVAEAEKVIQFFDEAMTFNNRGGVLDTYRKLDELWDYLQSLSI